MAVLTNPRERTRFLKFMVVGAMGAVVDFGTFNILSSLLHIPAVYAQVVSFTVAVVSNFLWNRYWTYPDSRTKQLHHQLVQFFVVNIVGLAIRTPIFIGLEKPLTNFYTLMPQVAPLTPQFLGHNSALAVAVLVVMLWNFFINRVWTYNDVN